jgi:hypothetical protein
MQMAAAQLGADAVIVQGAQAQSQWDYWQYPKTSGVTLTAREIVTLEEGRAVLADFSGCAGQERGANGGERITL